MKPRFLPAPSGGSAFLPLSLACMAVRSALPGTEIWPLKASTSGAPGHSVTNRAVKRPKTAVPAASFQ